jgi:predicted alpha/beta superfamily hydrolase
LEDFVPYIQVGIGFAGPDAEAADVLRNRIYVPPDEPIPPSLRSLLSQYSDSTEEYETLLQSLQDTHADLFLEFLETKLKSEIESRYRVVDEPAGLYGYSYSGLFSLYALFRRSSMFARVGVGSPGVLTADSKVFSLEQDLRNVDMPFRDTQLHMTLCELEMTGRTHVFRDLSIQYARLIDKLYLSEHKGLSFTARVLPNETHVTGVHASFLSFLRTCYAKTRDKLEL